MTTEWPTWATRYDVESYVYFITNDRMSHVKIGLAKDPARRLKQLQTGHQERLVLAHAIPGDREEERYWHERYATLRVGGEWFQMKGILGDLVRKWREEKDERSASAARFTGLGPGTGNGGES